MSDNKPYGSCPICGADGKSRERRPNGDDTCIKGHKYKSADSITNPDTVTLPREDLSALLLNYEWFLRHFEGTMDFDPRIVSDELTKALEVKSE